MNRTTLYFLNILFLILAAAATAQKPEKRMYEVREFPWGGRDSEVSSARFRITNLDSAPRSPVLLREDHGRAESVEQFPVGILGPNESRTIYTTNLNGHRYYYGSAFTIRDDTGYKAEFSSGGDMNHLLFIAPANQQLSTRAIQDMNDSNSTAPTRRIDPKQIMQTEPDDLPRLWKHYAGFEAVILDVAVYDKLPAPERAALDDYVFAGGTVLFTSAEQSGVIKSGSGRYYNFTDSLTEPELRKEITRRAQSGFPKNFTNITSILPNDFLPSIKLRNRVIFGIIAVYVILAGPISLWYWSRRKKREMLFRYLPAYSVLFSILAIVAFYSINGFNRYSGSTSITVIHPETRRAATRASYTMLTAFHPGDGLRFSNESLVHFTDISNRGYRGINDQGGLVVTSGGIQPNVISRYNTGTVQVLRERPAIDLSAKTATNTYSVPWHRLVVHLDQSVIVFSPAKPGETVAGIEHPVSSAAHRTEHLDQGLSESESKSLRNIGSELIEILKHTQLPASVAVFTDRPSWIKAGADAHTLEDLHIAVESLTLTPPQLQKMEPVPPPPQTQPDPYSMSGFDLPMIPESPTETNEDETTDTTEDASETTASDDALEPSEHEDMGELI